MNNSYILINETKIPLNKMEILALKTIYNKSDVFGNSSIFKSLMGKNLIRFSNDYRNVVLTDLTGVILQLDRKSGIVEFRGSRGEIVVVEWEGL